MTQPSDDFLPLMTGEPEPLKELLSTCLDVAGCVAVSAGVGWGLFPVLGPYAVAIGGVILIGLNAAASLLRQDRRPEVQPEAAQTPPLPGPTDAGLLHVSGR